MAERGLAEFGNALGDELLPGFAEQRSLACLHSRLGKEVLRTIQSAAALHLTIGTPRPVCLAGGETVASR